MGRVILACALIVSLERPAAAQGTALADALSRMHADVSRSVVDAAEKMPDADFAFQASKDARSCGGCVGHLRLKGLVPPSTARAAAPRPGGR